MSPYLSGFSFSFDTLTFVGSHSSAVHCFSEQGFYIIKVKQKCLATLLLIYTSPSELSAAGHHYPKRNGAVAAPCETVIRYKSLLLSNFLSCNYWKSRFILELTTCVCVHLILQVIHNHGSYTFLLSCTISSFVGFCLFLLFLYVQHFYRNYTDGEYTADIHTWDVMSCGGQQVWLHLTWK